MSEIFQYRLTTDSNSEFESPENDEDQTSYYLSNTNRNFRNKQSAGPSTSAAANMSPKKYYAHKSTSVGPYGRSKPKNTDDRQLPTSRNTRSSSLRGRELPDESEVESNENAPPISLRKRKQSKPRSRLQNERRFLKEVRHLQNSTDFMIPRLSFGRVVRSIIYKHSSAITMVTKEALSGLQEATEMYLTQVFSDAYLLTLHRKRVTLSVEDFEILRVFRRVLSE